MGVKEPRCDSSRLRPAELFPGRQGCIHRWGQAHPNLLRRGSTWKGPGYLVDSTLLLLIRLGSSTYFPWGCCMDQMFVSLPFSCEALTPGEMV